MTRWFAAAVALALLSAARACADDFSDFRIPAHRVYGWDVRGFADASRYQNSYPGNALRNDGVNGSISTSAFRLFDSDARFSSITAAAAASGRRTSGRDERFSVSQSRYDRFRSRTVGETWLVSLQDRRYPWDVPVGVELSASGRGSYGQDWSRNQSRAVDADPPPVRRIEEIRHDERWSYSTDVQGSLVVGWGRVRDATGVYDVQMLEERLQRAGSLSRPLSTAARRRLAELLYARTGLDRVAERPAKYLWREVGRILRDDGALAGGASDPWTWISAIEPYLGAARGYPGDLVPSSPVLRFTGVFLGPVIVASHLSSIDRLDRGAQLLFFQGDSIVFAQFDKVAQRVTGAVDEAFAGAKGELHSPLGPRWQADAAVQVVLPLKHTPNGIVMTSNGSLRFIRSDRWTAGVSIAQVRSIQKSGLIYGRYPSNGWSVDYGGDISVYIEDHVDLTLAAHETQDRESQSPYPFLFGGYRRFGRVSIGLTYRLLGHFEASGLAEPFDIHRAR